MMTPYDVFMSGIIPDSTVIYRAVLHYGVELALALADNVARKGIQQCNICGNVYHEAYIDYGVCNICHSLLISDNRDTPIAF